MEELLIPNCNKIPNDTLCKLLVKTSPSLMCLDISNKLSPTIDREVMRTLVHSCRYLTVLKLSDYRTEDPKTLLVLCGRVAVTKSEISPSCSNSSVAMKELASSSSDPKAENMERLTNVLVTQESCDGETLKCREEGSSVAESCSECGTSTGIQEGAVGNGSAEALISTEEEVEGGGRGGHYMTREEAENQGVERGASRDDNEGGGRENGGDNNAQQDGVERGDAQSASDDDDDDILYEDDSTESPLEVEDHSSEFGCLELETLWLENVNLTDQVAAVLLQCLPQLRDINLSDTDICNPWRLMDKTHAVHLKRMADLDVKSTALSKTALEMIPDFHPTLQKLAISSTTLPPPTYCQVARLNALAELDLIGGQFYPCEPEVIFTQGIMPAVSGVGQHLQSLNLTYFAHVEFTKVMLSCPMIRHLDLSRTDIFVKFPCPSVGRHCPNLTSLNLGFAHIDAKDASGQFVAEERVTHLMVGECKVLEELHLSGLTVTDDGIKTMYPGAEYPLRTLNVSWCKKLTIAGVRHVWDRCPFLSGIDMTQCKQVLGTDYKAFLENCRETRPLFKVEGTMQWK